MRLFLLRMHFGYSNKKFLISIRHSEKSGQIRTTPFGGSRAPIARRPLSNFATNLHFTTDLLSHFGEPRPSSLFVGFQTKFLCDLHSHGDCSSSSPKWIWNRDERVVRPVRNLLPVVHVLSSLFKRSTFVPKRNVRSHSFEASWTRTVQYSRVRYSFVSPLLYL